MGYSSGSCGAERNSSGADRCSPAHALFRIPCNCWMPGGRRGLSFRLARDESGHDRPREYRVRDRGFGSAALYALPRSRSSRRSSCTMAMLARRFIVSVRRAIVPSSATMPPFECDHTFLESGEPSLTLAMHGSDDLNSLREHFVTFRQAVQTLVYGHALSV